MAIHKPGKVLLHHIPMKFVHDKVAGGGGKSMNQELPLVPFIDFLITLVVFLLMNFSASGELVAQREGLRMPTANNTTDLELAPIISIDSTVVLLDGARVADTATLAANTAPQAGQDPIPQLTTNLQRMKRQWATLYGNREFPGEVILQADVDVPFEVIKQVMMSATIAEYGNLSFAVNSTGE